MKYFNDDFTLEILLKCKCMCILFIVEVVLIFTKKLISKRNMLLHPWKYFMFSIIFFLAMLIFQHFWKYYGLYMVHDITFQLWRKMFTSMPFKILSAIALRHFFVRIIILNTINFNWFHLGSIFLKCVFNILILWSSSI